MTIVYNRCTCFIKDCLRQMSITFRSTLLAKKLLRMLCNQEIGGCLCDSVSSVPTLSQLCMWDWQTNKSSWNPCPGPPSHLSEIAGILVLSIAYIFKNLKFKVLNRLLKKSRFVLWFLFLKGYFVCKYKILHRQTA